MRGALDWLHWNAWDAFGRVSCLLRGHEWIRVYPAAELCTVCFKERPAR